MAAVPLTADRNTLAKREGVYNTVKLAADAVIYMGAMVMKVAGYAVPAADAAGGVVIGRADDFGDNTGGDDGDVSIRVREGVFLWDNDATVPLTEADMDAICYVLDDHTVSKDDGVNAVKAGRAIQLDEGGTKVWVKTMPTGGI